MKFTMYKTRKLVLRIIKAVCFTAVVILLTYAVRKYSLYIGLFKEFEVRISGNQFVDDSVIQDQLYPYLSQSLLSLDLREIQTEVVSIDFVESIQVSRILPHTLFLQIIEVKPILLLNINGDTAFMDAKGVLLSADQLSIGLYPVPTITLSKESESGITDDIAEFFQFILDDYPMFYENLSEVFIYDRKWTFYNDSKTRIFATSENIINQFNILKNFERTVYPIRSLDDYTYIDLRLKDQVVVKEKYRKG